MKAILATPPTRTAMLARAAFARLYSAVSLNEQEAVTKAMRDGESVLRFINRAAAPIGTTTDAGFAAEIQQTAYGEYLAWLAPGSAAARMIGLGLSVPLRTIDFKAPARNTAPTDLPWVGEAAPIPVRSQLNLVGVQMTPRKMASMSIFTRETAKAGAEGVITTMLREDGERSLDAGYFSTAAGDAETHPGLLSGVSAIAGYGGGDKMAFEEDIAAMLDVVAPNGTNNIVLVTSQKRAQRIALKFPDFRTPVFASQAVADSRVIMVDAGALVHSFGDYDIELTNSATVHMEDTDAAPIVSTGGAVAAPVRSLWQTDSMALRIVGDVAFAGRKANVVAYVDNPTW